MSIAFNTITISQKSLALPLPNATGQLKTAMSSPLSSLLRYRTLEKLFTCIPSILPEYGFWVIAWKYPSTPTEILACFGTLVLWGFLWIRNRDSWKESVPDSDYIFKSAGPGGKTELVPPFDSVSVKWLRTHWGRNSLQRRQLGG